MLRQQRARGCWTRSLAICASFFFLAGSLLPVSVAAACEGVLQDESVAKEEFEENALYEQILTYHRNGGPASTGTLTEHAEGPFEMVGTCGGKSLGNGASCTAKVKCTGPGAGIVEVYGTELGIVWWRQGLKC